MKHQFRVIPIEEIINNRSNKYKFINFNQMEINNINPTNEEIEKRTKELVQNIYNFKEYILNKNIEDGIENNDRLNAEVWFTAKIAELELLQEKIIESLIIKK